MDAVAEYGYSPAGYVLMVDKCGSAECKSSDCSSTGVKASACMSTSGTVK